MLISDDDSLDGWFELKKTYSWPSISWNREGEHFTVGWDELGRQP